MAAKVAASWHNTFRSRSSLRISRQAPWVANYQDVQLRRTSRKFSKLKFDEVNMKLYCAQNLRFRLRSEQDSAVCRSRSYRWSDDEIEGLTSGLEGQFEKAVDLFNAGDYYTCHDVLEAMWHQAGEPQRSLLHALLQCTVALHHLLSQNHRGAMMELGEGLAKLRRCTADGAFAGREMGDGTENPFVRFASEAVELQEFVYNTQMEQAACSDDVCVQLDGSDASYQLLGDFAAGRSLYRLSKDPFGGNTIEFCRALPESEGGGERCGVYLVAVKVPRLCATEEHFFSLEY